MNKEIRRITCINVKNYVSQRQKEVRFLALANDKPRDSRDIVKQCCGPLQPGYPRLTPVRCERADCSLPLDIRHLSEGMYTLFHTPLTLLFIHLVKASYLSYFKLRKSILGNYQIINF